MATLLHSDGARLTSRARRVKCASQHADTNIHTDAGLTYNRLMDRITETKLVICFADV